MENRVTFYTGETMSGEERFAATIGFFDGVHQGHRFLIDKLKEVAHEHRLSSMIITFERHPRQVLHSDWQPQLLSSLNEKKKLLEATEVDRVVVLRFDEAMSQLSAYDFMEKVLLRDLHVQVLLTGYDNHFGHRGKVNEGFDDYMTYGQQMGIEVVGGTPLVMEGVSVSSSVVRRLLSQGKAEEAARCLGRPYRLNGKVVHGEQIGRQLGFPTANLQLDDADKLVPQSGVYAVRAWIEDSKEPLCGMMNIGMRPTFDGHQQTLETYLFDYSGNLYDKHLAVDFVARLREERYFDSADELVAQMQQDELAARRALKE